MYDVFSGYRQKSSHSTSLLKVFTEFASAAFTLCIPIVRTRTQSPVHQFIAQIAQTSTQQEVLHMMAAKYIETMQLWLPKKKIANFDWKRFIKDVQDVFERQGWLEAVGA